MRILKGLFLALISLNLASAAPVDEIEGLLRYIGGLEGASFIRNGDVHTPKEAEAHLRLKWTKQKAQIETAEDFVRLCGTGSSMSGQPYLIRFKDGHEETAASVLLNQLRVIRSMSAVLSRKTPDRFPKQVTPAAGSRFARVSLATAR